ncbi:MAG: ABC transporter permease [Deltaproteobacteria bacterium]|nr:ABC transporter permease [Deltaproteobacteria bacterium]
MSPTRTIAAVALRRMLRGRALWVGAIISTLPIGFAALTSAGRDSGIAEPGDVFGFVQLMLAVLPALFVASSIGEDIEDRTITYLWSRPIPRWSVLVGKLIATVPVIWLLSIASWCLASLAGGGQPTLESCLALALGGAALSIIAATIATLAPRYGMALTVCYMLFFDLPLGVMPAAIRYLSITQHDRTIADLSGLAEDSASSAAIGVVVIAGVWALIGLWRIRRLEA